MNVGELNNVKACVFVWNQSVAANAGNTLVVPHGNIAFDQFRKEYPDAKRCEGLDFDQSYPRFFACYVEDCHDPLVLIVRADTGSEAEEAFVNAKDWADIAEEDMKDYDFNQTMPTERGTWYETESVCIREVFLSSVLL